jgi:spore coat polysaccharide biosynthesis protein SpsF
MPNVGVITQARMTSTRLPGKVLLTANGTTVLEHHLNRLAWSEIPVFVATTTHATDEPIVSLVNRLGKPVFRGDEHNVLERFYLCALHFKLDVIIRVTSDCPLIDGKIVAEGASRYTELQDSRAYYSNALMRTFPRGLDFEVFSFELLKQAYENASEQPDLEHVTPYIHQNKSKSVHVSHFTAAEDHSDLRWTLDTQEDWRLIKTLIETYDAATLPYAGILAVVQKHPELKSINTHVEQKEI